MDSQLLISIAEAGFTVRRGEELLAEVEWDDVEEIRAYKRDLFTMDLICWAFCRSGDDDPVEVDEQMAGFKELEEAVRSRFQVGPEDWFDKVAYPAFATNMTVIWRKAQGDASQ